MAAPGNPGIAELATCVPLAGGVTDSAGVVALARRSSARPRRHRSGGPPRGGRRGCRARGRHPVLRSVRGGGPAGGEQGLRQGGHVRGRGADRARPRVHDPRRGRGGARRLRRTPRRQGRRAGRRQGSRRRPTTGSEALEHAPACLAKPDGAVVVEEFLSGPEVSLFCLCDGTTVVPLSPAQDFKRVRRRRRRVPTPVAWGPTARSTGHPRTSPTTSSGRVAQPVVDEMHRRGTPFVGRPLRRARPDLAGPAGHRVQRALRRPRDPGGAGAAAITAREPPARGRDGPPRERPAVALVRRARRDGRRRGRGIPRDPSHG